MKRFVMASTILLALTVTALGGDIPSVDTPQPPPSAQSGSTTSPGEIPTSGETTYGDAGDATLSGLLALIGIAF